MQLLFSEEAWPQTMRADDFIPPAVMKSEIQVSHEDAKTRRIQGGKAGETAV